MKFLVVFFISFFLLVSTVSAEKKRTVASKSSQDLALKLEKDRFFVNNICTLFRQRKFLNLEAILTGRKIDLQANYPDCFWRALGTVALVNKHYLKAIRYYEKIERKDILEVVNLSAAYLKTKQFQKAQRLLRNAIIEFNDVPDLVFNLALVELNLKEFHKARENLIKILNSSAEDNLKKRALKLLNYIGY